MRLISFGNLYLDYYFKDDELIGIQNGKTNANILVNLSKHYETSFFGVIGNDIKGNLAKEMLEEAGVKVKIIKQVEGETKAYFIKKSGYTQECPYCHREIGYHGSKFVASDILPLIKDDDVIVVDDINSNTIEILKQINNIAFLDIGSSTSIMYKSLDEIEELLANRFKIINMNERVYKVFKKKFDIDSQDIYELLKPDILIITRGSRGCDIIANNEFIKKEIIDPVKEVDSNGAGDAFFSEFIRTYLESNYIDEKMISKAYMRAQSLASYVVALTGSRSHIVPLKKIVDYKECICKNIKIN